MTSPFNTRAAGVGSTVALRHNAETVTRTDAGGDSESVTAIVMWDDPTIETDAGRNEKQTGKIQVASTQTVADSDKWTIDSVDYQTTWSKPAIGGLITLGIVAVDFQERRDGYGNKL